MSRAQARRSNTVLFKPLKDTDFKQAERVTRSYVRMHPGYANNTSSPTQNTNQLWVSVPFGSEDYSFQIMRKNTYEEQLFKIEDEKYEFDWNTLCYKRCIKVPHFLIASCLTSYPLQQVGNCRRLWSIRS
jgi:paired amphipathic helix protein Sin3a